MNLLLPMIYDTITVNDVLDESFFQENPDQSISLVIKEELFDINLDSLVMLPDTLFSFGVNLSFLPNPIQLQPGDTVIQNHFFLPIDIQSSNASQLILEKAILRQGNIVFDALNVSSTDLQVVLGIEGASHPETGSFFATEKVANNEPFEKGYNITDYHLDMTGPDGDTVNMFNYYVALIIHPDEPGEVTIYPEDSVALNVYFQDIIVDYARGYFGNDTYSYGPEIYPIDLFDGIDVKSVAVEDAEVYFNIKNTYGADVNFYIESIKAINSESGKQAELESPLLEEPLYVARAEEMTEETGDIQPHLVQFDFSDSNFPDLLSIEPDQISYQLKVEANVTGDSTVYDNFFYYDYPVSVELEARVNGGIRLDSLFQSYRQEWNGEQLDIENVISGDIKLVFTNAFPFDFSMNLYFEDQDTVVIDTLIFKEQIAAGIIGSDEFVSEAQETRISIPLDDRLKESFKKAKFYNYELYINSANGNPIKMHKNDYMRFKVVGDFKFLFQQN